MVILDKNKAAARIVLTLNRYSDVEFNAYRMKLHSPYTNKEYIVDLGVDLSAYESRYSDFEVPVDTYADFEAGGYIFTVEGIITSGQDDKYTEMKTGHLKVIDVEQAEDKPLTINHDETEDDYIVYQ